MKKIKKNSFSFLILLFILALSSTVFAENSYHYATTDMTWSEFYAGEINQTSAALKEAGLDAYTSATAVRMFSYVLSADKTTIQGIKDVKVRMTDEVYKNLQDTSRYSFTPDEYTEYKEVNADGSFGKMVTESQTITPDKITLASGDNAAWGSYQLTISTDQLAAVSRDNFLGAVIETDNGSYGLRHVNNLWRAAKELALTVDDAYVEIHGTHVIRDYKYTADIVGKTIKKITYLVKDGADYVIDNLDIKLAEVPTVKAVEPESGFIVSGNNIEIKMSFNNVPDGVNYTISKVQKGGGRKAVTLSADTNYTYSNNILILKEPEANFYRVNFKSSNTDTAPNLRAGFYLYTVNVTDIIENSSTNNLMFRITPEGAYSKTDAVLQANNWVNATDYTTSSDNYSGTYTAGFENEIKGSGFSFDITLKGVPEGKTAILGFAGTATLTAENLGGADLYTKIADRIKKNSSTEEDGVLYYSVDETTFKDIGISVKSVSPDRDLTSKVSAGAMFLEASDASAASDESVTLIYGSMLADSNSETETTYPLSNEGDGEMLLNDGAADGHIKASWYLSYTANEKESTPGGSSGGCNSFTSLILLGAATLMKKLK